MKREEFLRQLRLSLQQKATAQNSNSSCHDKIEEQMKWYEDYILMQIRKGKDEAEVLEYLGDPRLLADSAFACDNIPEVCDDWEENRHLPMPSRILEKAREIVEKMLGR